MNGNEFEAAFSKAIHEYDDENPAMKKSNVSEEWTNLAGSHEEGIPTKERKVWMDVKTFEIGRDFNVTIRGLFERINPLKYEATIEGNKILIFEEDEKMKLICPSVLKLHSGLYKFTNLTYNIDIGSMNEFALQCNKLAISFAAEIPAYQMEIDYMFQIQTSRIEQ